MSSHAHNNAKDRATCRSCGALIVPGQERCRMCGSAFRPPSQRTFKVGSKLSWAFNQSFFLMVMSVAIWAIFWIIIYVIPAPLVKSPGLRLVSVLGILFILTAMIIMLDARKVGSLTEDPAVAKMTPVRWFGYTLISWFVALPAYLKQRPADDYDEQRWRARVGAYTSIVVAFLVFVSLCTIAYRHHRFNTDEKLMNTILDKHKQQMMQTLEGTRQ